MAEPTQDIAPPTTQNPPEVPRTYARCHWCGNFAAGARLVRIIEEGSGPGVGGNLFACKPCRALHGLVPLTDRL